jgi:hypothetical protein
MVDKGNRDGHRRSMSGLKVQETSKWGHDTAIERYGKLKNTGLLPKDEGACYPQRLGDKNNLQGPDYNNDASGWVRGAGENAENKPGYVHGYRPGKK